MLAVAVVVSTTVDKWTYLVCDKVSESWSPAASEQYF